MGGCAETTTGATASRPEPGQPAENRRRCESGSARAPRPWALRATGAETVGGGLPRRRRVLWAREVRGASNQRPLSSGVERRPFVPQAPGPFPPARRRIAGRRQPPRFGPDRMAAAQPLPAPPLAAPAFSVVSEGEGRVAARMRERHESKRATAGDAQTPPSLFLPFRPTGTRPPPWTTATRPPSRRWRRPSRRRPRTRTRPRRAQRRSRRPFPPRARAPPRPALHRYQPPKP
jgi:hypothetical protein